MSVMLNVAIKSIIQSVYMLSVVMLNVIMLNVIMLNVIMLNVIMLNVMAPLLGAYTTIPNRTGDQ